MSLLEEWDIQGRSGAQEYDLHSPNVGSSDLVEDAIGSTTAVQQPIFSLEVAERNIAR